MYVSLTGNFFQAARRVAMCYGNLQNRSTHGHLHFVRLLTINSLLLKAIDRIVSCQLESNHNCTYAKYRHCQTESTCWTLRLTSPSVHCWVASTQAVRPVREVITLARSNVRNDPQLLHRQQKRRNVRIHKIM